jgi:hypothetical protein
VFRDDFQILVPDMQSDRVNVHTFNVSDLSLSVFCSPDLPLSGTLGPAVKFENQQEFL